MRLFIAFPLEDSVTSRLSQIVGEFERHGGPIKWVEPKNMHLTARFLGETPENQVDGLIKVVNASAAKGKVVKTVIQQIGGFPNLHRPRVIWAGMDSEVNKLIPVAAEIERLIKPLGFAAETKPFKPHLTLGRVREDAKIGNSLDYLLRYQFAPIPVLFDRLALIKSTLTPRGPIYDLLHEVSLPH